MRSVPDLLDQHRPVVTKHVEAGAGAQIHSVSPEGLCGVTVLFGPVSVGQALCHERPEQARPVGNVVPIVISSHDHSGQRVLYAAAERRISLRKETRVLAQHRCQQERPEELAGGGARHGGAEALAIAFSALSIAVRVIFGLTDSGGESGTGERRKRYAVVYEQLELPSRRKRALGRGNIRKDDRFPVQGRKKSGRGLSGSGLGASCGRRSVGMVLARRRLLAAEHGCEADKHCSVTYDCAKQPTKPAGGNRDCRSRLALGFGASPRFLDLTGGTLA